MNFDLKLIEDTEPAIREMIVSTIPNIAVLLEADLDIDAMEIIESESFHIVNNREWVNAPMKINMLRRIPLKKRLLSGDDSVFLEYISVSVLLHSMRAIIDLEINGNKKLLLYCQRLWRDLAGDNSRNIPKRFM
jgi:hypothetical protein